jgi:hypothetical protein
VARIQSMLQLPPPNTKRWVARRKATVVMAVSGGMISLEEACRRYQMSEEEFLTWQRAFEIYGVNGLHATSRPYRREALDLHTTKPASSSENLLRKGRSR